MAWAEAVAGDPAVVDELLAEADRILDGGPPGDLLVHDIGVARGPRADPGGPVRRELRPADRGQRRGGPGRAPGHGLQLPQQRGQRGRLRRRAGPGAGLRRSLPGPGRAERPAPAQRLRRDGPGGPAAPPRPAGRGGAGPATRPPATPTGPGCPSSTAWSGTSAACSPWRPGTRRPPRPSWPPPCELGAPVGRPSARLRLAEALARAGRADQAETELRAGRARAGRAR